MLDVDAGNGGNDNGNGSETTPPKPEPGYKQGDVNGDGYVSSKDYNAIRNHITGKNRLKEKPKKSRCKWRWICEF